MIYRVLLRVLYRNGRMRVPVVHEVGMALLAWWLLTLFSASVSPAFGFSLKPSFPGMNLIPVYGTIRMVKESGVVALFGAFLKYVPIGFLVPFLFRRSRNPVSYTHLTAEWFTREDAPPQPLNISLTSEMIWQFKNGQV